MTWFFEMVQAWFIYLVLVLGTRYIIGSSMLGMVVRIPFATVAGAATRALASVWMKRVVAKDEAMRPFTVGVPHMASVHVATIALRTLSCPSCLGFWVGIAYASWFPLDAHGVLRWVLTGFVAMFASKVWHSLTDGGDFFDTDLRIVTAALTRTDLGDDLHPEAGGKPAGAPPHDPSSEHDFDDSDELDQGLVLACFDCNTEFAMFSDVDITKIACPRCGAERCHIVQDEDEPKEPNAEEAPTQEAADARHG